MKRILIVSKYRAVVGGVETHIETLVAQLRSLGYTVRVFTSDDVSDSGGDVFDANVAGSSKLFSAKLLMWNSTARKIFQDAVAEFKPDIIHYHSIYHQLSPSVLGAGDVPAVMTLHDFKLIAPCYSLLRDGAFCDLCVTGSITHSVRYKCVKNSPAASAICATETRVYKRRYNRTVSAFIVPSTFSRDHHLRGGIDRRKLRVVPWGVPLLGSPPETTRTSSRRYWIFSGRLHPSKGISELLNVWSQLQKKGDLRLLVAGDGELKESVVKAAVHDPSIEVLGRVESGTLSQLVANAELALVPSILPETFGLTALEALKVGTPIVSSGAGALRDFDGPGVLNAPLLIEEWGPTLQRLVSNQILSETERSSLSQRDLEIYSPEAMTQSVLAVYNDVLTTTSDESD